MKCSDFSPVPSVLLQSSALSVAPWLSGTRPDTNTLSSRQEIRQTPVSTCRGGTALCRNAAKNESKESVVSHGVRRRLVLIDKNPFNRDGIP